MNASHHVSEQPDRFEKIVRHHRHHHVELEISVRARPGDAASFPITCAHTIIIDSHMTGFTLPGMIELPGCVARQLNFADPAARPAAEPANVVRDLEQTDGDRL